MKIDYKNRNQLYRYFRKIHLILTSKNTMLCSCLQKIKFKIVLINCKSLIRTIIWMNKWTKSFCNSIMNNLALKKYRKIKTMVLQAIIKIWQSKNKARLMLRKPRVKSMIFIKKKMKILKIILLSILISI